jgi:hypothetical protein
MSKEAALPHPSTNWTSHLKNVPNGFLYCRVPKLLNDKPFSGLERTNKLWKQDEIGTMQHVLN